MKILAFLALTLLVGACTSAGGRDVRMDNSGRMNSSGSMAGQGPDTVLVCHKGKVTMSIPTEALQGHLQHGDKAGAC
jgi:hypothetical protein